MFNRKHAGHNAQDTDNTQHRIRWIKLQQHENGDGANPGANQVDAINQGYAITVTRHGQRNSIGDKEKRQRQQQITYEQALPLARIPQYLQCIEGQLLDGNKADDRRKPEHYRVKYEHAAIALQQAALKYGYHAAAGAITQQRNTDDHEGKMMPVDNREKPDKQHFVGKRGC